MRFLEVTKWYLATSYELQAMSYELRATSYELRVTSYELQATSYKLRATSGHADINEARMCPMDTPSLWVMGEWGLVIR